MNKLRLVISERWLTLCTTWIGVYPLLTGLTWVLEPLLDNQPLTIRSLIMSVIMVPIMVLLVMPVMQRLVARLNEFSQ